MVPRFNPGVALRSCALHGLNGNVNAGVLPLPGIARLELATPAERRDKERVLVNRNLEREEKQ
jgi:hypothetical protein